MVSSFSEEGDFVRIRFLDEERRRRLVFGFDGTQGYFDQRGVAVYEGDVHPVSRFLIDTGVDLQKPIWATLDLETDSRVPFSRKESARILCWSITHQDGDRVAGVLEEDSNEAERELVLDLFHELQGVDQIRTWNGSRFDEDVLRGRLRALGLNRMVSLRRWLLLDAMECFRKYHAHSAESGGEKESVALARVAEALGVDVGDKEKVDASMSWELWSAGGAARKDLARRNWFDSWSMTEIERKTGYCDLHYAVCRTSGCLPDTRSLMASVYVEAFLMRLGAKRGIRAPTKRRFGDDVHPEEFEGAFVFETEIGLHRNVHVCDFAGMYPGIIQSWNMSPETHRPEHSGRIGEMLEDVIARAPPGVSIAPRTLEAFDTAVEGLLPIAVGDLKRMRKIWNEAKKNAVPNSPEWHAADQLSQGAKIAVNSCFGVIGSPYSRYFVRAVGESITTTGAWLIAKTIEKATHEFKMHVIAGDTDSMFAKNCSEEDFRRFKDECNRDLYPELLKLCHARRNEIVLEYEKEYEILISCRKKRYAGRYSHYKGSRARNDTKPDVKGLEYKRGDQIRLTRQFQEQVVRKLLLIGQEVISNVPSIYPLVPEDFEDLIRSWRERVLEGELSKRDVVISQSLSKKPGQYAQEMRNDGAPAAQPIHVVIAKILEARGAEVTEGTRIEYVVVDGDSSPIRAIPAADYRPGLEDRAYLWEKEVWRPVRRVLEVVWPEHRWSKFDDGKDRGGGKGRSRYLPGQQHFGFFD